MGYDRAGRWCVRSIARHSIEEDRTVITRTGHDHVSQLTHPWALLRQRRERSGRRQPPIDGREGGGGRQLHRGGQCAA